MDFDEVVLVPLFPLLTYWRSWIELPAAMWTMETVWMSYF